VQDLIQHAHLLEDLVTLKKRVEKYTDSIAAKEEPPPAN
jgi:hypothetical protein